MENKKRIKLFTTGVIFGTIIMYFMVFKDRNVFKSPQEVILGKMIDNPMRLASCAACQKEYYKLKAADLKLYFQKAEVSFSDSKVHQKPWPIYTVNCEPYVFICEVGESENMLLSIQHTTQKDTCKCN